MGRTVVVISLLSGSGHAEVHESAAPIGPRLRLTRLYGILFFISGGLLLAAVGAATVSRSSSVARVSPADCRGRSGR